MAKNSSLIFKAPTSPSAIVTPSTGSIEFDVLVSTEETLKNEVTKNPVETGFLVADHIIIDPIKISIVALVTNTPVTWFEYFGGSNPDRQLETIQALEMLHATRQLVTLFLKDRVFENMAMTDCKIPRNKENGLALKIPMDFEQVVFVDSRLVDLPDNLLGSAAANQGGETQSDTGTNNGNPATPVELKPSIVKAGLPNLIKILRGEAI